MRANRKINILSIYRGILNDNRGTPIRVKSLSLEFSKSSEINYTMCAWDNESSIELQNYMRLSNKHFDDIKKIYNFVKKNNVDVIIGHTMATYYYLFPLRFLTKAKIALEMHGYVEEEAKMYGNINWLMYSWSKFIFGVFYRLCHIIFAPSETSREILSKYNKNTVSIVGGVDLNIFNPNVARGSVIRRKSDEIIIGYAGNTRIWQGLPFLLDSFIAINKISPEFKLALLCSEEVKNKVSNVLYFNKVEHSKIPDFFIDCDILVIPRMHNEVNRISIPSKLFEYMAMGKPVVASNTSDVHRIIRDKIDGLIFNAGDKEEFKKAILSLRDRNYRDELGNNAFNRAKKDFVWNQLSSKIIEGVTSIL